MVDDFADLPAEPKKSLYYTADRMGPVELASCAFGQSSKISYLEMASAVCAEVLEQTLVYKGVPRAAVPDTPASDAETSADLPEDGDSFDGA